MNGRPFVSFVGAGPGDPELVTLKALRRLREADVVIHDRLIPAALLAEAPADAEIIDAGKAPGRHCMGQAQINWLLVDRARRRGRVVRLKGGDPAIFGRLAEGADAVRAGGVACEVVPGVTAATAAAARGGISLTARGHASMLVLATGSDHAGRGVAALDWELLARAEATLVFYMPMQGLDSITTALTAMGRDHREPALVVERAGTPDERVVAGRLGDIAARRRAGCGGAPAPLPRGAPGGAPAGPPAPGPLTAPPG